MVTVSDRVAVCPTATPPKLTLVGETVSLPERTAVPASQIREIVPDGLVAKSIVPHSSEDPRGVNLTVSSMLELAAIVTGRDGEAMVKSLPLTVADKILTSEEVEL